MGLLDRFSSFFSFFFLALGISVLGGRGFTVESQASDNSPVNPGFEHGLQGWTAEGQAFSNQPTRGETIPASRVLALELGGDYWKDTIYPIGVRGSGWLSSSDPATGSLVSEPFRLERKYITFLVSGGMDLERLRVELLRVDPSVGSREETPARVTSGHNDERFRREIWDLSSETGNWFRFRIVDQSVSPGGHLNLDDITLEDADPRLARPETLAPFGQALPGAHVDSDAPIWGFADLHTHPMSHLAFGGKLLHGAPDGDIKKELGNCKCTHGGWSLANACGNTLRLFVVSQADGEFSELKGFLGLDHEHRGFPHFRAWPHFTSVTHQQMWVDWLRRAWQGGLRVIVGLAVNNHLMAEGIDGALPRDDRASADLQLQAMKEFAQRHSDFIEIADSPAKLRQIVRAGKLALIEGVEIDNIGNFNFKGVDSGEDAVRREIRRLHAMGVRYFVPIHLTDNAFGGAAITGDLFNLALRFNQAQPLAPEPRLWTPGPGFEIETAPDPLVRYRLNPPMKYQTMEDFRIFLRLVEAFPFPWPDNPSSTLGGLLSREKEYEVVKRFFLSPMHIDEIPGGHRNRRGLTQQGLWALDELMRLGAMIDIDHMSERSVEDAFALAGARNGRGGVYPLSSGHDYIRSLGVGSVTENSRTDEQLDTIRKLGGSVGLEWEYLPQGGPGITAGSVSDARDAQHPVTSAVPADCGGSSKAFAQHYLHAIERLGSVSFGTDINGLVKAPGPRFGVLSRLNGNYCPPELQKDPVKYHSIAGDRAWDGPNVPLLPLRTGGRTWDINVDGVAHYGLLPDFLQDLKNVGVRASDLDPLFSGAEALARTWERSRFAAARLRGQSSLYFRDGE